MLISDRLSVRAEAERFLATHGFSTPPLPPDEALAARNLEVAQLSLDDLLVKANLPSEDHKSIQAMLNPRERMVVFRSGTTLTEEELGFTSRGSSRVSPLATGNPLLLSVALVTGEGTEATRS